MKRTILKTKIFFLAVVILGGLVIDVLWAASSVHAAIGLSLQVSPSSFSPRSTALELGTPTIAQTVNLQAQYASAPGDGTVVKISVSSQCLVADYAKGGFGSAGSSATTTFNAFNTAFSVYVWGVDDTKHEGTHSCSATVTTTSSNPEANGVTAAATITIEDNDSAPAPTPSTAKPKPTPAPAAAPVTKEVAPPPAIPVASVKVNDQTNTVTEGQAPSFEANTPVALSGTTIPNGKVKLYIFSELRTAEVTADAQGNWNYSVADLEPGDHHVEAEVTDPATGKTSPKVELARFKVNAATTQSSGVTASQGKPKSKVPVIIGVTLGILALAAGGFFGVRWWRHKKATSRTNPAETSIKPDDTPSEPTDKEGND